MMGPMSYESFMGIVDLVFPFGVLLFGGIGLGTAAKYHIDSVKKGMYGGNERLYMWVEGGGKVLIGWVLGILTGFLASSVCVASYVVIRAVTYQLLRVTGFL